MPELPPYSMRRWKVQIGAVECHIAKQARYRTLHRCEGRSPAEMRTLHSPVVSNVKTEQRLRRWYDVCKSGWYNASELPPKCFLMDFRS